MRNEKIKHFFINWKKEVLSLIQDRHYLFLFAISWILLSAAGFFNTIASDYVDSVQTLPVDDLLYNKLPLIDLSFFFVYGYFFIIFAIVLASAFISPKRIPFVLFSFSIFIATRAVFITLTHIGVSNDHISPDTKYLSDVYWKNDLFFSGHVGTAFLGFLLFKKPFLKEFFLIGSILMSVTVISMRIHYSIDVFSAFFITYGIYNISEHWFSPESGKFVKQTKKLFKNDLNLAKK